jgi:hypothetical protein
MIFGMLATFAIEAELREVSGKWTFGRLRFWIGGLPIGDFEETCDLATSARWGRTFLGASHRRSRTDLDKKPPAEVYENLQGRFLQPVGAEALNADPEKWDREPYCLDEIGESSTRDVFSIVVARRGDGTDRVIVQSHDEATTSEALVPPGVCDAAIESYCAWVEGLR